MKDNDGKMFVLALVAIGVIAGLAFAYGGAFRTMPTGANQGQSLSMVSVSASGVARGIPSNATVNIMINGTGASASAATANLSASIAIFNSTVYNYVNGNMSLVQTQYYGASKQYSYNGSSNTPYQAYESITVKLPSISRLNGFLVNITEVPNLEVDGVSASLSDAQITQLRPSALKAAIANATMQGQAIIGSGTIVNSSISIESYNIYPYPLYDTAIGGGAPAAAQGNLYYNGTSSIVENVQATFYYRK